MSNRAYLRCETCGAECQTPYPLKKLRSKKYVSSWFDIHDSIPHKIVGLNNDCLRLIVFD